MEKYLLSYTAASLLTHETETVAKLYLELQDWESVKVEVVEQNVLQKNALSTRKREYSEIKKRLSRLTAKEFALYGTDTESRYLAFLACIKTYRLIYEFVAEVLREKVLLFDDQILPSDYTSFFESKQAGAEELNAISEVTEAKLRQVLFRILADVGLIDSVKRMHICVPTLPRDLVEAIIEDDPMLLRAFLVSDRDIQSYIEGTL